VKRLAPHLTYANLASSLALALALTTGGAYAASKLAPRSVGERQLRPGAVTAAKLRKNAVVSAKIAPGAVTLGKIAPAAVDASRLAGGAVGPFQLAGGAVIAEKLANDAVTGEKVNESTLGQVPSAAKAESATTAESANPMAFAKVGPAGTLEAGESKGISAVKESETGVYCVTVASFSPTGAQVTPTYNGIGTTDAFVRIGGAASCPSPQIEVQTWNGGAKLKAPFLLIAYR
jgi:trimeric autotransporter adhesin